MIIDEEKWYLGTAVEEFQKSVAEMRLELQEKCSKRKCAEARVRKRDQQLRNAQKNMYDDQ